VIGFAALAAAAQAASVPSPATFKPFEGPKPIAVLIEQNPWLMVIGSDVPRVAVYENGDVIFLKQTGKDDYEFRIAHLAPEEIQSLERTWDPLVNVQPKSYYDLLPGMSDAHTTKLYVSEGNRAVAVNVYGLDCDDGPQFIDAASKGKDAPPAELFRVHQRLCDIDFKNSEKWTPKYVEVLLWDYHYAPDKSIYWPKDWPDLKSDRAFQRGDMWSIFFDAAQLPRLNAFLKTQKEKGAVEVDGRKWSVAYRYTFPSEPVWRKAMLPVVDRE
jgi:hypothetical protein